MATTDWIMITYGIFLWLTCESIIKGKGQNIGTTYSIRNYNGPHEPLNDATRYAQQEYIQQYYPALSGVQAQPNQQLEYQGYSSAQYPGYEQQGLALTYASPVTQTAYGSFYQAPVYSNQQTQDGQLPQSNYYVQGRDGDNPFLGSTYYPGQGANTGYYQPQGSSNSYRIQAPSAQYQGASQRADMYGQAYSARQQPQGQVSGSLQGQSSRLAIPNPFLSQNTGQQLQSQQLGAQTQESEQKSPYLHFNIQSAQQQQQRQFHPTIQQLQQRQQVALQAQQFPLQQLPESGPLNVQQQLNQFQQQQQQLLQQQQEQLEQPQQQPRQEQQQQQREQGPAQHPVQDPGDTEAMTETSDPKDPTSPQAQGNGEALDEELPQGPSLEGPLGERVEQQQEEGVRDTGAGPVEGQGDEAEQGDLTVIGNTGKINEEDVGMTKEQQVPDVGVSDGGKEDEENTEDTEAGTIVNQNSQNGEVEQAVNGHDEEEISVGGQPGFVENKDSVIDSQDAEESDEPEVAEQSDEENHKGNNGEQKAPELSKATPLEVKATTPEPAAPKTDTERPVVRERTTHKSFHGLFRSRNKVREGGIRSFRRRAGMYPGRTTPSGTRYYLAKVKGYHPLNRVIIDKGRADSSKVPKDANNPDNGQTGVSEQDLQQNLGSVSPPEPSVMPEESAAVESDSETGPTEQPPLSTLVQPQDANNPDNGQTGVSEQDLQQNLGSVSPPEPSVMPEESAAVESDSETGPTEQPPLSTLVQPQDILSEPDQELQLSTPSSLLPESLDELQEPETDPNVPSDQESQPIKSESQDIMGQPVEEQLPVQTLQKQQEQQSSLQVEEPTTPETLPEQQQVLYIKDESEKELLNGMSTEPPQEEQIEDSHSWDTNSQAGPLSTPNSILTQTNNTLFNPREGSHNELEITHSTISPVQHRDKETPSLENQNEEKKESLNHVGADISLKPSKIQQGAQDYVESADEQGENQQSSTSPDTEIAVSRDFGTSEPTTITVPLASSHDSDQKRDTLSDEELAASREIGSTTPTTITVPLASSHDSDQKRATLSDAEIAASREIGSTAPTNISVPLTTSRNDQSISASNYHQKKVILNTTVVPISLSTSDIPITITTTVTDMPINLTTKGVQTKPPVSYSSMMEQTDNPGVNTLASYSNEEPTISPEVPPSPQVFNGNVMEEGKGELVQFQTETQSTLATPYPEMRDNISKGSTGEEPKGSSSKGELVQAQLVAPDVTASEYVPKSTTSRHVEAGKNGNTSETLASKRNDSYVKQLKNVTAQNQKTDPTNSTQNDIRPSSEDSLGSGEALREALSALRAFFPMLTSSSHTADSDADDGDEAFQGEGSGLADTEGAMALILAPYPKMMSRKDPLPRPQKPSPYGNQGTKATLPAHNQGTTAALPSPNQGTTSASSTLPNHVQWLQQEQARLGMSLLDRLLQAGGATMIRVDLGKNRKDKSRLPMLSSFLRGTKIRRGVTKVGMSHSDIPEIPTRSSS